VESEIHLPDSKSQTRKINIQNQRNDNFNLMVSRDNTIDDLEQKDSKFDPERSTSSINHSIASRRLGNYFFVTLNLEELRRQQAKLEKIQSEKQKLEAFLNYQAEVDQEKERKENERQMKLQQMYDQKATTIQKYARRWLARRYVEELKEMEYRKQKALLTQALDEMRDQIRVVGTDSKERFISAAIVIQKHARARFIRKLLAPYFDLFRRVNPIVLCFTKLNKVLPLRNAFYKLAKNANICENSVIVSQVDTTEEQRILHNFKKIDQNPNQKFLEIQVNQSIDGANENQTYKMIMSHQNISNHEDFSIEDDSDGEGEDSDNGIFEQEQKDKFDNLLYDNNIEPIEEEDGEESKYAPTPQKPVTSKMQNNRAVG
jgi:hypothetical protein